MPLCRTVCLGFSFRYVTFPLLKFSSSNSKCFVPVAGLRCSKVAERLEVKTDRKGAESYRASDYCVNATAINRQHSVTPPPPHTPRLPRRLFNPIPSTVSCLDTVLRCCRRLCVVFMCGWVNEQFAFNTAFNCQLRKLRIPMASLEESHNPKRVEEDRG